MVQDLALISLEQESSGCPKFMAFKQRNQPITLNPKPNKSKAQRGLLAARLAGALRREEGAEASRQRESVYVCVSDCKCIYTYATPP